MAGIVFILSKSGTRGAIRMTDGANRIFQTYYGSVDPVKKADRYERLYTAIQNGNLEITQRVDKKLVTRYKLVISDANGRVAQSQSTTNLGLVNSFAAEAYTAPANCPIC